LVRDKERGDFLQIVQKIRDRFSSIRDFGESEADLAKIIVAIERSRMVQVEAARRRLQSARISSESLAFKRIMTVLDKGDVDTANEYIDLAASGADLPELGELKDIFGNFFPRAAADIDEFLSDPHQSGSLLSRIETQKGIPGVEMRNVPGAQVTEAIDLLEAWFALKKTKRANKDQLRVLFERLGFEVLNLSEGTGHPRSWIALQTKPLSHRDQSPLPYFGSLANGNYRILCIWDRPSEEEIVNQIRSGRQGSPILVLYFGRLTEQKRRDLARLSRADHLSFLLVDEVLIVYLCGERGARMPILFQCALPFTFVSPYTTTASLVPPEMFYGRKHERRRIIDPMGSCFVYGGRQLGKTALLLSIRDEFHQPSEGRIAVWIDLKAAGATQDDIWLNLARAFREAPNVDIELGESRSEQKLVDRLHAWLARDERRRILLLLDEADRFLESDSKDGFRRTSILKGLMEKTNRRFKVVFAGLHNVQRTTKQQNHPLAHFGEPICVGPLLDDGEWKDARELIERPLRTMGFRFESLDLVTRILSQTNYYPSLIQLYCNQLFHFLTRESAPFDWKNSPPYVITSKHVEDAYSRIRNGIRERFELTLNLDIRYRVIALIIALYNQPIGEHAGDGMTVSEIRREAVYFWERGFLDSRSEEDFRSLLDEMVGLGVLRDVAGHFALRSPNILSLLGTQDEIESKLVSSSSETPPPPFEAHLFRTSDQEQNWRRNPLTVLQESELHVDKNNVTILYGTRAAGLDDVSRFLLRSFGTAFSFTCGPELTDRYKFQARLAEIREQRKSGTTLVLVQGCPWTDSWIDEALDWSSKKAVSKFSSVLFVADPSTTWTLMQSPEHLEELIRERVVNTLSLKPWHASVLWQWLGDCGIGSNAADEQELISRSTGNWPYLLMEFRRRASSASNWRTSIAEVSQSVAETADRSEYLSVFGVDLPEPSRILSDMAFLGGRSSVVDLSGILENLPEKLVNATICWADRLSLATPSSESEWQLDPIVAKLLTAGKSQ